MRAFIRIAEQEQGADVREGYDRAVRGGFGGTIEDYARALALVEQVNGQGSQGSPEEEAGPGHLDQAEALREPAPRATPYRRTEARQAYWRRRRTDAAYLDQAEEALKRAGQVNAARAPVHKPSRATRLKILGIRLSSARARYAQRRRRDPALLAQSWEALKLANVAKARRSRRVTHPELPRLRPAPPPAGT